MFLFNTETKKAVAYYRHSAEDKQENSVPIQREHAQKFAQENNIEIIHEEADEGKSGLSADRPGFNALFENWICNPRTPEFDYVLVYDVSHWGRFQDQDEPAYYEFRCKQQGKKVVYISRGFVQKDHQLISHLQTSIERYMAAEYSRQLSDKVFNGCVKVSQQGYSAGGTPCYGLARLLLDSNKKPVRILKDGEQKAIANERVTFIPLSDQTTNTVKNVFYLFVNKNFTLRQVAANLNNRKIPAAQGGKWDERKVLRILTNEVYVGSIVYNKTCNRLKSGRKRNPRKQWILCKNAFPAVIEEKIFQTAQDKINALFKFNQRKNCFFINKTKNLITSELKTLFKQQNYDENKIHNLLQKFPISISAPYDNKILTWCFTVRESTRKYSYVLCVGVDYNITYKIFLIPAKEFSTAGYKFIFENDRDYWRFKIKNDEVKIKILALAGKMCLL